MSKLIFSTLFCALAILTGCSTTSDTVVSRPSSSSSSTDNRGNSNMPVTGGECDADPAQNLLGATYTPNAQEQAKRLSGAAIVRTLFPGQLVTMEYNPQRVNLLIDESNKIIRANCG